MKSGFSALELIMAIALSAIIMTTLLEIYYQVTRNMARVERFVFEDTQILTLKNRLNKDLSGLSAIWFTQSALEAQQLAAKEKIFEVKKPLLSKRQSSKFFYSVNKDKRLDILTFVTTAGLQSYGDTQDRFVRVVYQVEVDPKNKEMFRLMRKEISMPTEYIDEEALQPGRFYELVDGIKSIEVMYQLIDKIEIQRQQKERAKPEDQKSQEKEELKPIIRSVKQWDESFKAPKSAAEKGKKDEDEEEVESLGGAAVPKFIEMKIVFGATDKRLEKEYKLDFYIPATVDNIPASLLKKSSTPPATNN
ncbi:MAG: hypothetical protein JO129_03770 [Candidatus Dependentiae bacterium]|nr:hypothetical protein [Candidatus Dependentiae bacterium]